MAHIQKYKAHSCGHMLAHYRRDESSLERDNIDPSLTDQNVTLVIGQDGQVAHEGVKPNWQTIKGRIDAVDEAARAAGKRATRKDAVVMADLVVTLPQNVREGDGDRFFELTYEFFAGKVGADNLMGGFVHRDEMRTRTNKETGKVEWTGERVRDHMHVPFTPILEGRFNYKRMVSRTFYQTLHKELGDFLERGLGYRPDVQLTEEQRGDKALSQVKNEDIDATRAAIERQEDRLECLQRSADAVQSAKEPIGQSVKNIFGSRGLEDAKRSLEAEKSGLEGEIEDLERDVAAAGIRIRELEREIPDLERRIGGLERSVERARGRFAELAARVRGYVANVGERAAGLLSRFGVEAYAGQPPIEVTMREAQKAARSMNVGIGRAPRDRGIGR